MCVWIQVYLVAGMRIFTSVWVLAELEDEEARLSQYGPLGMVTASWTSEVSLMWGLSTSWKLSLVPKAFGGEGGEWEVFQSTVNGLQGVDQKWLKMEQVAYINTSCTLWPILLPVYNVVRGYFTTVYFWHCCKSCHKMALVQQKGYETKWGTSRISWL